MTDVPIFPNVAVGFRQWQVNEEGWLFGTGYSQIWRPGVNTAVCGKGELHLSTDEHCECGLYAYAKPYDFRQGNLLSGVIVANGALQTERVGFRAEQAMIVALAVPPRYKGDEELVQSVARRYAVPLESYADLELIATRYGEVPKMLKPPKPRCLSPEQKKQAQLLARLRKRRAEVAYLTLIPEGPLLDVGVRPDVTRLRTMILLAARQPGGTTKDQIVKAHWPRLAAWQAKDGTAEYDSRWSLMAKIESAFTYLRTARLIVGIPRPNGGNAKIWHATEDGHKVKERGEYTYDPVQADIKQRHEAAEEDERAVKEGSNLALPTAGPVLDLGNGGVATRYRSIIVLEALEAGVAGVTRDVVRRKHWPGIPYYLHNAVNHYSRSQWHGFVELNEALAAAIQYLRRKGYIVGSPRDDGRQGNMWLATDKSRQLQVVGSYNSAS